MAKKLNPTLATIGKLWEQRAISGDMAKFLVVTNFIHEHLDRAEQVIDNPGKTNVLMREYHTAFEAVPLTQSDFRKYDINPKTERPVFPDYYKPLIEIVRERFYKPYQAVLALPCKKDRSVA